MLHVGGKVEIASGSRIRSIGGEGSCCNQDRAVRQSNWEV